MKNKKTQSSWRPYRKKKSKESEGGILRGGGQKDQNTETGVQRERNREKKKLG